MFTLAIKNIVQRKVRSILLGISICIGIGSLVIFLALSNGIRENLSSTLSNSTSLTEITVLPDISGNRFFQLLAPTQGQKLKEETLDELKKIDHIQTISPEYSLKMPVSIEGRMLGAGITTDALIMGVASDYIAQELPENTEWNGTDPIPFLVSNQLLDLYNFTIAQTNNLPLLRSTDFIGKEITIHIGKSTLIPSASSTVKTITGKVIGFSNKVGIVGITIPLSSLEAISTTDERALRAVHITVDDPKNVLTVAANIETLGYETDHLQKRLNNLEGLFTKINFAAGSISLLILTVVIISILNTVITAIRERRHSIGVMRSIGATQSQIIALFLYEAGIIGLIASSIGAAIGYSIGNLANTIIPQFTDTAFFIPTQNTVIISILIGTSMSVIASYLPAKRAATMDPLVALKR